MSNPLIQASLAGVLLLGLAACQPDADSGSRAPEPENVVARVNGEAIGEATIESQMQALSARGQSTSRAQALQEVITVKLLAQAAEEQGLDESQEVAIELDRQRSSLLAQQLIRAELDRFEPSEELLRERYQQQFGDADGTLEYHARHILLKEDRERAEAIIAQLDDGADFATLAKEQSEGPSKSTGGDLGWFQPSDMVQSFGDAVKALSPGEYTSEPVETQFGWHVVLLEETREADPPAFEEVRSQLQSQVVSEHLQQYVTDLRESAEVEILDQELAPAASADGSGSQ